MKKKVVMLLAALMLASSVTAYAGPWDKIRQVIEGHLQISVSDMM